MPTPFLYSLQIEHDKFKAEAEARLAAAHGATSALQDQLAAAEREHEGLSCERILQRCGLKCAKARLSNHRKKRRDRRSRAELNLLVEVHKGQTQPLGEAPTQRRLAHARRAAEGDAPHGQRRAVEPCGRVTM